jgi:nucleoside-triphosphatase
MVIVITGAIGIGKTTICEKLLAYAKKNRFSCGGVLTYKTTNDNRIIFNVLNGDRFILASNNGRKEGPFTPRYIFNPAGIDFGIKAIEKGISADILFIDELGPIELMGQGFAPALEKVLASAKNSVLVIRKELVSAFTIWTGSDPIIFETTYQNRNELPLKIARSLLPKQTYLAN